MGVPIPAAHSRQWQTQLITHTLHMEASGLYDKHNVACLGQAARHHTLSETLKICLFCVIPCCEIACTEN